MVLIQWLVRLLEIHVNTHREMPCEDTGSVQVKCLQGREGRVLQATNRSYERGLELTLHRKRQRESALPTSQSHIPGLLNCESIHFSCLKASLLWYFMMEALGNSYNFHRVVIESDWYFWLVKSGFIFFFWFFMFIDIDFIRERLAYWKVTKFSSESLIVYPFSFCL